jgi:hypothetical protein
VRDRLLLLLGLCSVLFAAVTLVRMFAGANEAQAQGIIQEWTLPHAFCYTTPSMNAIHCVRR